MDKILLLGGNGFVGKHFINFFYDNSLDRNYELYVASSKNNSNLKIKNFRKILKKENNSIENLIKELRPSYIINLIGEWNSESISRLFEVNFSIAIRIIESCLENKINLKKLLLIGSAAEYGISSDEPVTEEKNLDPINFYGLSKKFQADLAIYAYKNYGLSINIARIFNLLGEEISESLAPGRFLKLISEAEDGSTICVGNLSCIRDFIGINEAVPYLWKILIDGIPGEIYNVCSGQGKKMKDLLLEMINESGKKIHISGDENIYSGGGIPIIIGNNMKVKKLMNIK